MSGLGIAVLVVVVFGLFCTTLILLSVLYRLRKLEALIDRLDLGGHDTSHYMRTGQRN